MTAYVGVLERLLRLAGISKRPRGAEPVDLDTLKTLDVSGVTLFGERTIRLRNLTGEKIDPTLGDPGLLPGVFKIRLARSRRSSEQAGHLIQRRYAWRGYQIPGLPVDPNLRTFVAYRDNALVGTVSLRIDSSSGLSADELYKAELDEIRRAGARLCEFTRLAVDDEAISKAVLGGLFHTAYMYAHFVRDCDFGVIEVNPRHAVFYRRSLFFDVIGPERMNKRVNAPSVLLRVSFATIEAELEKFFADPPATTRLMFSHWFPPDEAEGVLGRLKRQETETVPGGLHPSATGAAPASDSTVA